MHKLDCAKVPQKGSDVVKAIEVAKSISWSALKSKILPEIGLSAHNAEGAGGAVDMTHNSPAL